MFGQSFIASTLGSMRGLCYGRRPPFTRRQIIEAQFILTVANRQEVLKCYPILTKQNSYVPHPYWS